VPTPVNVKRLRAEIDSKAAAHISTILAARLRLTQAALEVEVTAFDASKAALAAALMLQERRGSW